MEAFSKTLLNNILGLFLDPDAGLPQPSPGPPRPRREYLGRPLRDQALKIVVLLRSKDAPAVETEVFSLCVAHAFQELSLAEHRFTELSAALLDSPASLAQALSFLGKFCAGAALLSPYVAFYASPAPEIVKLRKTHSLDFRAEEQRTRVLASKEVPPETSEGRKFLFHRVVENSLARLAVDVVVRDNLREVLATLSRGRVGLPPNCKSDSQLPPHFLSASGDREAFGEVRYQSQIVAEGPGRPFKLLDELSCNSADGGPPERSSAKGRRNTDFTTTSSIFRDSGLLVPRRPPREADLDFSELEKEPTLVNVYYMASQLQKALRHALCGALDESEELRESAGQVAVPAEPDFQKQPDAPQKVLFVRFL